MRFRNLKTLALAAAVAAAPAALAPASAATSAEVQPGMTVVDPSGGTVGLVTGVRGDLLILKTDAHEVQLPLASFTAHEGKLLFGMTAAQLNAETEKAMAEANAAVAVGAQVFGSAGEPVGQIEAVEGDLVTIKLASGNMVRLPRSGVGGSANGAVLGMTAAELDALAGQATVTPAAAADDGAAE